MAMKRNSSVGSLLMNNRGSPEHQKEDYNEFINVKQMYLDNPDKSV